MSNKHRRPEPSDIHPNIASAEAPKPLGAWWNNLSRKWLVPGLDGGEPVALDPQPPPPARPLGHRSAWELLTFDVPVAVKVEA